MFRSVVDLHLSDIGCLHWEKLQQHGRCNILGISINGVSTICSFESWVIYVPIGCRCPFIKYLQPLLAKTTATCSLPHPENEHQQSVNSFSGCIFGNYGIALIPASIMESLTALTANNTMYQR